LPPLIRLAEDELQGGDLVAILLDELAEGLDGVQDSLSRLGAEPGGEICPRSRCQCLLVAR
jgi:hypothetical protein